MVFAKLEEMASDGNGTRYLGNAFDVRNICCSGEL
tara:strand:+ start:260 stop:364 length:105 start_codon:yes stop_codon:yes gene_type:complete